MATTRAIIDVDIVTSGAARELRQLQAQFNSFQSALNKNNRLQADASKYYAQQLKDLANQSGYFTAETVKMRTAASQLDQTLSKGRVTMGQFFSARFRKDSAAAAQVLSLANARAAAMETAFAAAGGAANGFRDAIAIRPLQAFNSAAAVSAQRLAIHRAMLMQATTSMINFGKNTQWAGRQLMVGFTVPLTIFGAAAGKVFKEIETEIVNFKKVYGDAFTPPEELEQNIEMVKDLAKEYTKYGIAVKDTIGLAAQAAAAGAQGADLMAATSEATRLATLGQMDQNKALETAIALQNAFGISSDQLANKVNFLNMVENQTVVTLQDLAEAIPRVAPVIKGLGGTVEDMAAFLAAMQEGGVSAAQGANALKSGLASLINPTNKAQEALEKMGINLTGIVQTNRGDLMGVVQDFARALSTLDEFSRQQALEKVFGKFQYARLGALFNNIVKDGSQAARVMDIASMSAQELAASANKELGAIEQATSVKFTAAMERLKLAIAPIGEMFMKVSIPVINFFTQLAEKFNSLPDFAKKFAALAAIIVGVVIPAGTMFLGLLMNLIGTLIKFGSLVGIAFKGFTTGGIKGAVDAVSQALRYMSLEEIDAANASRQLGTSTEIVNQALRDQVPSAAGAMAAIERLAGAWAAVNAQMAEAAALSKVAFVAPGAAMGAAAATGAEAGRRSAGPRLRRNKGGTIPGAGNTDTVPAMLTPGEFVVNKQATAENLPLLYAINKGGKLPGFNKGGKIPGVQYFARDQLIRVVSSVTDDWTDDMIQFSGKFATGKTTRPPVRKTQAQEKAMARELTDIQKLLDDMFNDSVNGKITTAQIVRALGQPKIERTLQRRAKEWNLERGVGRGNPHLWTKKDVDRFLASDIRFEKAHFATKRATTKDVDEVMKVRGSSTRAQFIEGLHRAGIPVTALTDDWATFSRALNQAANRGSTEEMTVAQAIKNIAEHKDKIVLGPAMQRAGISEDSFADNLIAVLKNERSDAKFTDEMFTSARNAVAGRPIEAMPTGLRMPSRKDLQEWVAEQTGRKADSVTDALINSYLNRAGYEMIAGSIVGAEKTVIRKIGTKTFERIGDSTAYNKGGMVGGVVNAAKNFYGRFNAKTIEMFTKWISSQPSEIKAIKGAVGVDENLTKIAKGGFRKSKGPEVLERATWMTQMPKPGDTMSLGALASFSPKGTPVTQHLADSKLRKDYEAAAMFLGMDQKKQRQDALNLRRIREMGPENLPSWAPERRYYSPITKTTGLDEYIADTERFMRSRQDSIRRHKGVMRDYKKYSPTIIELQTPRGTIRANLDDIVDPKSQKFMGNQTFEKERILHNAMIEVVEVKEEINGIKRIVAKLKSSEYPMIQQRNAGGPIFDSTGTSRRVVPGVGNTDTVPAMLTPGEFVINKQATTENLPLLHAINSGMKFAEGGKVPGVQYLVNGNVVDDWGTFVDPEEKKKTSLKERFEKSPVGKYAERRLAAGDRAGRLMSLASLMQMEAQKSGIFVQELDDFSKLPDKEKYKERNLRKAEAAAARYEKANQIWRAAGMPAPPPELSDKVNKQTSRNIKASTVATGAPAPKTVFGFDKNGRPITNQSQAVNMLKIDELYDYDGKRTSRLLNAFDIPVKAPKLVNDDVKTPSRGSASRASKIWMAIAALTSVGTVAGIATYEKNKREVDPLVGFNQGGQVPAMLTPGEFVVSKKATMDNLPLLHAINSGLIQGYELGGIVQVGNSFLVEGPDGKTEGPFGSKADAEKASKRIKSGGRAAGRIRAGGVGGTLASLGMSLGLGTLGFFGGSAAGEQVGGESGAMIGGIAGSMATMLLPSRIGKVPTGGLLPAIGQGAKSAKAAAPVAGNATSTLLNTTPGFVSKRAAGAGAARLAPMLAPALTNPLTAAIVAITAAIVATTVTFYNMKKSNDAQYEVGRKLADAMSTSAADVAAIGTTARERAKNIDSYLDASESEKLAAEYNVKISEAKTKAEKERLEIEKKAAIQERGSVSRRERIEEFYKKEISEAKKRNASEEELRNLYEQRNRSLGVFFQRQAQFEIDTTFGAKFIKGVGEKDFKQFSAIRDMPNQVRRGDVSAAQAETVTRLADAAYGMSMSAEKIAQMDMANKLAQYILSGTMTQDEAASVAEAIGKELGNLQIGKDIRQELTSIVGAEGLRAQYSPGLVAMQMADQNARRVEELRSLTNARAGAMFTTNPDNVRDFLSPALLGVPLSYALTQRTRTFDQEAFEQGAPTSLNRFNQFFSGMADEYRRNIGALIELQANEIQMLEENISAVGLRYDELIANAKTLADSERLRLDRARAITKLQERADEARQEQMRMAFGTPEAMEEILRPYRERREASERTRQATAISQDRFSNIAPLQATNFIPNIIARIGAGLNLLDSKIRQWAAETFETLTANFEEAAPSTQAQLLTTETVAALEKKYEGTDMQAQFAVFKEMFPAEISPELYRVFAEMFNDPEFSQNIILGFNSAMLQLTAAAESGQFGPASSAIAESITTKLKDALYNSQLPIETLSQFGSLIGQLDAQNLKEVNDALVLLETNYGIEMQNKALERFMPLFSQLGNLSAIKLPGLGGESIIGAIFGDPKTLEELAKNDDALTNLMEFIEFVANLKDPDLQLRFLEDKTIEQMIKSGKQLDNFNPKKFKKEVKNIQTLLEDGILGNQEGIEDQVKRIQLSFQAIEEIEDPEIKATLQAQISPLVYEMLRILKEMQTLAPGSVEYQDRLDMVLDLQDQIGADVTAAQQKQEDLKERVGGGSKDDPLGDLMRQLRDTINLLAKEGQKIFATGEKAKSIFERLRGQGANEALIGYLRSMSPEQAIKVGEELLKDRRKLNTLMALIAQEAVVASRDAAVQAQEQQKFANKLASSLVMSGTSFIDAADLFQNEEFMQAMQAASMGPKPQRQMGSVLNSFLAQQEAQRVQVSRMMPTMVTADIQRNNFQSRAQQQLGAAGLSQSEIDAAMGNEAIMARIEQRMRRGKNIGAEVIQMAKDYARSQRTIYDVIEDSVSSIQNIMSDSNAILAAASEKIEIYNIRPLEEQLDALQRSSAEYSEQQRRLSRSLSSLQEKESDLREEQADKEKEINDYYDSRLSALEKVDKVNKQIAQSQQDQIDVASALSRGDIGAAAKAAAQMEARAAQAKRDLLIENLREKKQEDIDSLREATEQKIKDLTIEVNGELLTREQIQGRIDEIEGKIYENSLKEYDIQQKISAERAKQAKIADAQEKLSRGQNLINQLAGLGQIDNAAERASRLKVIKAEASVLGGTAGANLIKFIDENEANLLSPKWSDQFTSTLVSGLNTFGTDFSKQFSEFIKTELYVPSADLIADGLVDQDSQIITVDGIDFQASIDAANASASTMFSSIKTDYDKWNDEVVKQNPFDKLIDGAKRFVTAIKGEFADVPKKPGSGGSGGGKKPPKPGDGVPETDTSFQIATPFDVGAEVREQRRNPTLTTRVVEKDFKGQRIRITAYYDPETGKLIPGLTKYETFEPNASRRYSDSSGQVTPMSGYVEADPNSLGAPPNLWFTSMVPGRTPSPGTLPDQIPQWMRTGQPGMPGYDQASQLGYAQAPPSNPVANVVGGAAASGFVASIPIIGPLLAPFANTIGGDIAEGIALGISSKIQQKGFFSGIFDVFLGAIKSIFGIESPATTMIPVGLDLASGMIQGIIDFFTSPFRFIWNSIESYFKKETGTEAGDSTKTGGVGQGLIGGIFSGITTYITSAPGKLWEAITQWWNESGFGGKDSNGGYLKANGTGQGIIGGIFSGIADYITQAPGRLWTQVQNWWSETGFGGKNDKGGYIKAEPAGTGIVEGIFSGIYNWFINNTNIGRLWESVWNWITAAISGDNTETLESAGGEGSDKSPGIARSIWKGITNWIGELDVTSFVTDLLNRFTLKKAEFEGIGSTIGGWISSKINSAVEAAKGVWAAAKAQFEFEYFGGPIQKRAFGGMINYRGSNESAPGMMFGGRMKKFATGSFVPGIGNTDVVPAMLTPGEFVVRKSVAQTYGPLLQALNTDVFPKMNMTSYIPSKVEQAGGAPIVYNYELSVNVNGSNASADDIANAVLGKIKMMEARNIRGVRVG